MTDLFLSAECIQTLSRFSQLIVGFSGGLDSTVLLHSLYSQPQLRPKLIAVHVHHGISSNADYWQNHSKQFCHHLNIPFVSHQVKFARSANIEERAREARYAVFSPMLGIHDCLILGHHRDDQAETLLLQLLRGAGIEGLAGMSEISSLGLGTLIRPLLSYTRIQLEEYAQKQNLSWIEDESNKDLKYARNYLRHKIMPLITQKWPSARVNLARTAVHCQQAKSNLEALAEYDYQEKITENSLNLIPLKVLVSERIANVLRVWLKKNCIQMPSTVIIQRLIYEVVFASRDANPEVCFADVRISRYQDHLYLHKKGKSTSHSVFTGSSDPSNSLLNPAGSFSEPTLEIPVKPSFYLWKRFPSPLFLEHLACYLVAKPSKKGLIIPDNAEIKVQFRKGGEQIRLHGQTKSLKKLVQEWQIPPWKRAAIPLIYINNELAAVYGYAISDLFYDTGSSAWDILKCYDLDDFPE